MTNDAMRTELPLTALAEASRAEELPLGRIPTKTRATWGGWASIVTRKMQLQQLPQLTA